MNVSHKILMKMDYLNILFYIFSNLIILINMQVVVSDTLI
jgi:hypothetical protein